MEISKTRIENRMRQKTNPYLVNTIVQLKKTKPSVAKVVLIIQKAPIITAIFLFI
jgi:hypothetical protein